MSETVLYLYVLDGQNEINNFKKIVENNPDVFTETNFFRRFGSENFKQMSFVEKQMGTLFVNAWSEDDEAFDKEMSNYIKDLDAKGFVNFDSFADDPRYRVKKSEFMNADLTKLNGIYFFFEEV